MRFILNTLKTLIIITGAMFLTAFTINATDNLGNFSGSALGGIVSGIMGEEPRCPAGMTLVDDADGGFCIDVYEASPSEKCVYIDPANQFETRSNLDSPECTPVSVKEGKPWRNISQTQAVSACIKAGKRLPTNEEWYLASVGTPDDADSWGPDSCNLSSNRGAPGKTGTASGCVSYYGVYDMIGNVWEWVSDTVRNGEYNEVEVPNSGWVQGVDEAGVAIETGKSPDPNYNNDRFWSEKSRVAGIFRGGYWDSKEEGGVYSVFAQVPPSFVGVGVGFRCVK
jgi:formylglycine-generating enzyme required for sulfatase activity